MKKIHDAGILLGAGALAGAVVLFATVLTRAVLSAPAAPLPAPMAMPAGGEPAIEDTRTGETPSTEGMRESETPRGHEVSDEILRLAVERAPFAQDRQAPAERYRMPGERVVAADPPPAPRELPPAPDFRVLGTVSGADGGVAVIQIEGERPHVMAMGEELFGYRVASIGSGNVVLEGQGRSLNLGVAGPIPTGAAETADARGQRGQARGGGQGQQGNVVEMARERALEMARQMQAQGGGQVQVRMGEGRIVIQGPGGETREMRFPTGADGEQVRGLMMRLQQGQQQRPPQQQRGGGGGGG